MMKSGKIASSALVAILSLNAAANSACFVSEVKKTVADYTRDFSFFTPSVVSVLTGVSVYLASSNKTSARKKIMDFIRKHEKTIKAIRSHAENMGTGGLFELKKQAIRAGIVRKDINIFEFIEFMDAMVEYYKESSQDLLNQGAASFARKLYRNGGRGGSFPQYDGIDPFSPVDLDASGETKPTKRDPFEGTFSD